MIESTCTQHCHCLRNLDAFKYKNVMFCTRIYWVFYLIPPTQIFIKLESFRESFIFLLWQQTSNIKVTIKD
jgi:hypothetical protein